MKRLLIAAVLLAGAMYLIFFSPSETERRDR